MARHYIRADRMPVGTTILFPSGQSRQILDIKPAAWGNNYLKFSYSKAWGMAKRPYASIPDEQNVPIQIRYHASDLFFYDDGDERVGMDEAPVVNPLYLPDDWTTIPAPPEVPAHERERCGPGGMARNSRSTPHRRPPPERSSALA